MIIILSRSLLNENAAKQLARDGEKVCYFDELDSFPAEETRLVLLEINANGESLKLLDSKYLADKLYKLNISEKIPTVDLLISGPSIVGDDISLHSISEMASDIADHFYDVGKREIMVRVLRELKYDHMLLVPPSDTNNQWQIHGIQTEDLHGALPDFNNLRTVANASNLLWQGKDLEEWLSDPQHCIRAWEVNKRMILAEAEKKEGETDRSPKRQKVDSLSEDKSKEKELFNKDYFSKGSDSYDKVDRKSEFPEEQKKSLNPMGKITGKRAR